MEIVTKCEIVNLKWKYWRRYCTRNHGVSTGRIMERTDGDALRVIVRACAQYCGCDNRVTNQIELCIMISLSDAFKPNIFARDCWIVPFSVNNIYISII